MTQDLTLQTLDTLPHSSARFNNPALCLVIGWLVWIMKVKYCLQLPGYNA